MKKIMAESIIQKRRTGEGKREKSFVHSVLDKGAESESIVSALNLLLANYSVHFQKLRNYHWNVKGENFFDLHEQFELQYNEVRMNIDEIAERIRVFDMVPYSTMQEYLQHSEIRETGPDISSTRMVEEVLSDYRILLQQMNEVVEIADDYGDSGTEQMIKRFIKRIEKNHWMLSAFMNK